MKYTSETRAFHLKTKSGDINRYCILTGDPGITEEIAGHLQDAYHVCTNREFSIYNGNISYAGTGEKSSGVPVTVCSTGIGGPSAAIALEELVQCGADTFIRIGTCGGIAEKVIPGDNVIAQACVRQEGTSREYAPIEYPAAANFEITAALVRAAEQLGQRFHIGVIQSKDSFYGQHDTYRMPVSEELRAKWTAWKKLGVLASEMEAAALFTVSAALGVRCGAVLHTIWNQERYAAGKHDKESQDTTSGILCAIRALALTAERDRGENTLWTEKIQDSSYLN